MPKSHPLQETCCPSKPNLKMRPLMTPEQSGELAQIFKILANDTRLRLLHALIRAEEVNVTRLAEIVNMSPQAVSNQLQKLVDQGVLGSRRNGNQVYYRIVDPCVTGILDQGLCLVEDSLRR